MKSLIINNFIISHFRLEPYIAYEPKKPSLSDIGRITEVVCSFANHKGGQVLIGVSDKSKILGIDIGKNTIERLTDTIVDNTEPKIYPVEQL